jgi:hypothetical protein
VKVHPAELAAAELSGTIERRDGGAGRTGPGFLKREFRASLAWRSKLAGRPARDREVATSGACELSQRPRSLSKEAFVNQARGRPPSRRPRLPTPRRPPRRPTAPPPPAGAPAPRGEARPARPLARRRWPPAPANDPSASGAQRPALPQPRRRRNHLPPPRFPIGTSGAGGPPPSREARPLMRALHGLSSFAVAREVEEDSVAPSPPPAVGGLPLPKGRAASDTSLPSGERSGRLCAPGEGGAAPSSSRAPPRTRAPNRQP